MSPFAEPAVLAPAPIAGAPDTTPWGAQNPWRTRLFVLALLCAVWLVPGIISGFVLGVMATGPDALPPVSVPRALVWQILAWLPWALWTAVVVWVVRRFPFTRSGWPRAVGVHVMLCAFITSFQILRTVLLDRLFYPGPITVTVAEHIRASFLRFVDFEVVIYMAVVAIGVGIDYFRRYREQQVAAARLHAEMVQAQLTALRAQLNPHFLFNALNTVISLMDRDVPAAQTMVARLGDLLRLSLTADESAVPLARELHHVNQYVEIERIRFGDRLTVAVNVDEALRTLPVPSLVLQPLVENAIVHGVGPRPGPGHVAVDASRQGHTLVLRVTDDGPGLSRNGSTNGHGIGVRNTRARLAALYGQAASLTLRDGRSGGCVAEVRLPIDESATNGVG